MTDFIKEKLHEKSFINYLNSRGSSSKVKFDRHILNLIFFYILNKHKLFL